MVQKITPQLEAKYGWNLGESGWNDGMDENIIKFSFLFDRNIDGIVSTLPAPVNGKAYFNTQDSRVYIAVGSSYYSSPVPKWFSLVLRSDGTFWQFNGTSLVPLAGIQDLDNRIDAVELDFSQLGSAAYASVSDFVSQSNLDVAVAQVSEYVDQSIDELSGPTGASQVGATDGGTVQDKLSDVYRLHLQQNSTAVVTVYCDPVTGDDANPGTLELPYKTFQRAVNGCPRILTHQYIIDLRSAPAARGGLPVTYDEDVVIRDIHAPMTRLDTPLLISSGLRVLGAGPTVGTHDPADVKIGSLTVAGCTGIANPEVYGFTATRISPFYEQEEYVAVYGTQEAQFYNLAFVNTDGTKAGVRPYGSGAVVKGIDITGLRYGVWAKRGAYAVMQTVYGVQSPGSTYRSDEGAIVTRVGPDTVTGRADPRGLINYSYGLLHSQNGIDFVRGMYYGSPELGSALGQDALAVGYRVTASGVDSVAVGRQASATGLGAVAVGVSAVANFDNCTSLGRGATVTAANQVQLGNSNTLTYVYGTVQNRSDARDKADIEDTNLGIDFVMGLRPVSARWDYRDDYRVVQEDGTIVQLERDGSKKRNRRHQFFIAQEVAELCERMGVEFAGLQHHAVSGGEDVFSLGYDEFIPPLTKAIQQCWSRLDELESRIALLEEE